MNDFDDELTRAGKFWLRWHADKPVLEYAMHGYWSIDDAEAWRRAALSTFRSAPASGGWYMLGDYADSRPQADEVNVVRDEVCRRQIDRGVLAFVVYGLSTVALMQLKRLVTERNQQARFVFSSDRATAMEKIHAMLAAKEFPFPPVR
jgi:hypothetical protein